MELIAEKRVELGKKSKKLAREKKLPGVIFGRGMESLPITLEYLPFERLFIQAGESTLINLKIRSGDAVTVLISEVAKHPVTDKYIHASFKKVNLKEKISAKVPIKIVGESPIVKGGEGLLLTLIDEVTVEAFPTDLPHDIPVDISGLTKLDQGITVAQLPIDKSKIRIVDQDDNELVVKIDYAEMKEEVVEQPVAEAELVAKVAATEQLTEEEKAKRLAEEKAKKEKAEKE
ncbi:MAG: 50S ribosomal protein L25 [Patescibacteria group bacterium]